MNTTKRFVAVMAIAALAFVPTGAQASEPASAASYCAAGGITYNQQGQPAMFRGVRPAQGMNCASARYVMDKWLRRTYRRSYSNRLPTNFFDGYVTWHCGRTSHLRWRCAEYDSYTAFRFTAYRF